MFIDDFVKYVGKKVEVTLFAGAPAYPTLQPPCIEHTTTGHTYFGTCRPSPSLLHHIEISGPHYAWTFRPESIAHIVEVKK